MLRAKRGVREKKLAIVEIEALQQQQERHRELNIEVKQSIVTLLKN